MKLFTLILILGPCFLFSQQPVTIKDFSTVTCGDQRFDVLLPMLKNKKVAVLTNITGVINSTSIVDTLLRYKVKIVKIFGPEHGFRSNTEAGELVKSNKDKKTGLPVISLYGANKKPTKEQLKHIDVLIYDIQDVGVRFYTYISSMCYAMEACAENNVEFIVLDRPNPNGFYIDGPVLTEKYRSFLGLHSVPIVYGMTCGEYAQMANEEGWLSSKPKSVTNEINPSVSKAASLKCKLKVVQLINYDRNCSYSLPIKPSPNIPNAQAVLLYPNLGLFEGTIVSLGRGTPHPFQVLGHPSYKDSSFCFVPMPTEVSKEPRYLNKKCCGIDLRKDFDKWNHPRSIDLRLLMRMYNALDKEIFFEDNFNYHAGNKLLQQQIKDGLSESEIHSSWTSDIEKFKTIRKKYLFYPDFR